MCGRRDQQEVTELPRCVWEAWSYEEARARLAQAVEERWPPFFGQFGGQAKVESGWFGHAARRPWYASSGVMSPSAEWGLSSL